MMLFVLKTIHCEVYHNISGKGTGVCTFRIRAQGANDPRVNKAESYQMVAALRARGIEVEYMVRDNEEHGFRNQDSRYDFYSAMEKFLEKHLKSN